MSKCPHCGKDTTIQPGMLELLERMAGHAAKVMKVKKYKKLKGDRNA